MYLEILVAFMPLLQGVSLLSRASTPQEGLLTCNGCQEELIVGFTTTLGKLVTGCYTSQFTHCWPVFGTSSIGSSMMMLFRTKKMWLWGLVRWLGR